ncbi:unnamed protein product [Ostreobium quekettii]|uniref:GDT1 family protein n=1 Tax=Ostreobium quekettii TaxID=121088 RepID=A0A8S1J9S4_9CHLO|nr:unnamed protein product [Ostreobium quekettii]CAD7705170.1 unnamed protein product [Ostreobium quekettii]
MPSGEARSRMFWKLAAWLGAPLLVGAGLASVGVLPPWSSIQGVVQASGMWSSGFLAATSLVFFSEVGDKTFFIAGLLAMQLGRWVAFLGSLSALALMSVVSVGIGRAFEAIPEGLKASLPMGEYFVVALLVVFGASMLRDAFGGGEEGGEEGELADAREAVSRAEEAGAVGRGRSAWQAFLQVASLIFVAEWGDRSMLATIAMGATRNPLAVVTGATLGHAAATAIAVLAFSWAAQYISERVVKVLGGVTFLAFAVASLASVLLGGGA